MSSNIGKEINIALLLKNLQGTFIDDKYEFLKKYDKNSNSIFESDEIDYLKNDLLEANSSDNDIARLSLKDLNVFYQNALNLSAKVPDCKNNIDKIFEWLKTLVNQGNTDIIPTQQEYEEYKENYNYILDYFDDNLSPDEYDMTSFNISQLDEKQIKNAKNILFKYSKNKEFNIEALILLSQLDIKDSENIIKNYKNLTNLNEIFLDYASKYLPKNLIENRKELTINVNIQTMTAKIQFDAEPNKTYVVNINDGLVEEWYYDHMSKKEIIINNRQNFKKTIHYSNVVLSHNNIARELSIIDYEETEYLNFNENVKTNMMYKPEHTENVQNSNLSDNRIPDETVINGKKYQIIQEDNTIKFKNLENGFEQLLDMTTFQPEIKNILLNTPTNLLIFIINHPIKILYNKNIELNSSDAKYDINIGAKDINNPLEALPTFLHELGHKINRFYKIYKDFQLRAIFNKERKDFYKNSTVQEQECLKHLIGNNYLNTNNDFFNIDEIIADATMLKYTKPDKYLATRTMYLQKYFPETIAYISNLLDNIN